jgi:hypothetical protein
MVNDKTLRLKLKAIAKTMDETLKNEVISDALDSENIETYFSDLLEHGCVSGMISKLIYYSDTVKFYDKYENEIEDLLEEERKESGYENKFAMIASLNGADNVGSIDQEKNLLSWFAFEETARQLANEIGLEV